MSNIIYNSDGINIIEPFKEESGQNKEYEQNKIHKNINYKEKEVMFDTRKENIIYNADGIIHNYYYNDELEYKIKIKSKGQENISSKVKENISSKVQENISSKVTL